jgi:predicted GH43/DUF377 family glycosyl hydrolase
LSSVKAPDDVFDLLAIDPVMVDGPTELLDHDLMSPFVWRTRHGQLAVLLRAVPRPWRHGDVTGRIWHGRCSEDGLHFHMDDAPLLEPGPDKLDIGGCEDPTVVPTAEECVVYYTGLDENGNGQMLYASGPDIGRLVKQGVALASSKTERNTKEAAVERTDDGEWRLFYEYSRDCQSRVGLAFGPGPNGPWDEQEDPFRLRPECWDSWHLSTGPLIMTEADAPVMFYNGANRSAVWGVGWAVFDRGCRQVLARSQQPLIAPPPQPVGGRDIAFAASAVQAKSEIWLYLSQNDCQIFRARVRRSGPISIP